MQVKAAFYQQSKKHHPDVAGESPEAKDNFAALNLAYSVLRWALDLALAPYKDDLHSEIRVKGITMTSMEFPSKSFRKSKEKLL